MADQSKMKQTGYYERVNYVGMSAQQVTFRFRGLHHIEPEFHHCFVCGAALSVETTDPHYVFVCVGCGTKFEDC